jgi:probable phosphoglycerate mutase
VGLTVHLLRHGAVEPETPWRFLGRREVPLSAEGRAQARFWREALADVPFQAAWCSDLGRCRETASIILAGRKITIEPLPGLGEIDLGQWDGLSREEVRQRFPGQYEARGRDLAGFRPPGGESFQNLQDRAWAALVPRLERAEGHALVVAHAGTNRALLCRILDMPLGHVFRLGQDSGCRNVLDWRSDGPRLLLLNQQPTPVPA